MTRSTILCVDDDAVELKLRKRILELAGYSVVAAGDAALAMRLFTSDMPDLVVSDHLLEGTSGTELAAAMKRVRPAIPIIIMSGLPEQPEGMENADLFITKGDAPQVWLKKISDLLQKPESN